MPSHLHGLNVVHPVNSADSGPQDLLSGPFPDLSLWTHLPFDSEDGPHPANDERFGKSAEEEANEAADALGIEASAIHDGHVNVVTGTSVGNSYHQHPNRPVMPGASLDISSLLSSFGIDPLAIAQQMQPMQQPTPSLAQILALHAGNPLSFYPQSTGGLVASHPQPQSKPQPQPSSPQSPEDASPPAKRARSRKSSVSTTADASPETSADSPNTTTPLSASEDKRRRNTAASARFRLKKKEREVALENKAKELEIKVTELERECEGLRRENGWLKGLVVGVTGATQTGSPGQASAASGVKRPREE